jgi:protein CLEC16A
MLKSLWASVLGGPTQRKFTLDELRDLYSLLIRNPVVTESNKAVVVETIRAIAEFMIWGDQNEPRIFDYLLENNIMTYLHKILLQPANRSGDVAKQVLQTLSIIIQNVRSETAVFFLFSNNHVNNIVDLDFDFDDEEVLGFYVSFLKTISLKLNPTTVHFFLVDAPSSPAAARPAFPLYTRAVRLAHNREGMVRAAVRTITLNIFSVDDPAIHSFVSSPPASRYFEDLAAYLAEQVQVGGAATRQRQWREGRHAPGRKGGG